MIFKIIVIAAEHWSKLGWPRILALDIPQRGRLRAFGLTLCAAGSCLPPFAASNGRRIDDGAI